MSDTPGHLADQDAPQYYDIRIKGQLDPRWVSWFEGLSLSPEEDGNTCIAGLVTDQSALYGLLRKVRDLGMTLLSVRLKKYPKEDSDV